MKKIESTLQMHLRIGTISLLLAVLLGVRALADEAGRRAFAAPELAVRALQDALEKRDLDELGRLFGPEVADIINPDLVEATNEFAKVATAIGESNFLVPGGKDQFLVQYGRDGILFPVPLLQQGGQWFFDTPSGVEELINRRIGRNELAVLEVIRTYVQAQREYASADRDGDEVLEFAQKFRSTPGRKDGLYWSPEVDGTLSPLGPLAAEAEAAGYRKRTDVVRQPFHGYYFKILTRQGKHAPGSAHDYIINGNMIAGFALVAWPSEYGVTGVMTFIVNQQGKVFQKDLGNKTNTAAESLTSYDPDKSWVLSAD